MVVSHSHPPGPLSPGFTHPPRFYPGSPRVTQVYPSKCSFYPGLLTIYPGLLSQGDSYKTWGPAGPVKNPRPATNISQRHMSFNFISEIVESNQAVTEVEDLHVPAGAPRVMQQAMHPAAAQIVSFEHMHPGSKARIHMVLHEQFVCARDLGMAGGGKIWGDILGEKYGSNLWDRNKKWFNETYPGVVNKYQTPGDTRQMGFFLI